VHVQNQEIRAELNDVKQKLEESEENQNKRRCVEAAAQKEVEDSIYYFVEGMISIKRRQGGIRGKLYEYAERQNALAPDHWLAFPLVKDGPPHALGVHAMTSMNTHVADDLLHHPPQAFPL
jgi:hypothetical protein